MIFSTLIKKVDPDAEEDAAQQPLHLQEDERGRAGHLHHQGPEESCLPNQYKDHLFCWGMSLHQLETRELSMEMSSSLIFVLSMRCVRQFPCTCDEMQRFDVYRTSL